MHTSTTELDELHQMQENIRRSVEALEICWSCQRVSECSQYVVDDAAPVWLCLECHAWEQAEHGFSFWPSPR